MFAREALIRARAVMLEYPRYHPSFPKGDWVLPRILEHRAQNDGAKPFLQMGGRGKAFTFDEVNRLANRLARGFQRIGLCTGARLGIMMPNSLELIHCWFAANKLGAAEVPLNTAYKGAFLEHQLNISEARILVIAESLLEFLLPSLGALKHLSDVVLLPDAAPRVSPTIPGCRVWTLAELYDGDDSNLDIAVRPQDLAAILFTSGTTGLSKGVMMPHAQLYFFAEQDIQLVQLRPDDVYTTCLPLFHGNAQFLTVYPALIKGAKCVLYERFSASAWIDQLCESGATVTNTIGVMLPFVWKQPPSSKDRAHKVSRLLATPNPRGMQAQFRERFGIESFADAFGQTEICAPIMSPLGVERPEGACGLQVSQWFDIRLVNPETDEEVGPGEPGELLVRHKEPWTLNAGYVGMADQTLEASRNLWFHTGDAMRRDANGWYWFVDRIKDALRRRGENISSFEVEAPIRQHEAVMDVAVIGVPSDVPGGEDDVKACIVLKPGSTLDPETVIDWCEERLPSFTVPRYIEFLSELPKTPSEKTQKNKLREQGLTPRTWDRLAANYRIKGRKHD